jgi:hypothetical protein
VSKKFVTSGGIQSNFRKGICYEKMLHIKINAMSVLGVVVLFNSF